MNWQKFKEKYLGVDTAIVALGLLLFVVAMYYFLQNDGLTEVDHNASANVVGRVSVTKNNVRRRTHSGFIWSSVKRDDSVFEGDSIFTDESSDAAIELQSGSKVQIDSKSLVVIRTRNRSLQLDLQYGSLTGKVHGDTPLLISQNGVLQELSGQNAEIRIETVGPTKQTKLRVVKGEVKLKKVTPGAKKKQEPEAQVIKENEIAELKNDGADAVIVREGAELLYPENAKNLWLGLGQEIEFKWRLLGKDNNVANLEISSDPFFTTAALNKEIAGTSYTIAADKLPSGTLYWRVTPKGLSTPSLPFRLGLYSDVPPLAVYPKDLQEFAFSPTNGEAGKAVSLQWEDKSGSTSFELHLAHDPEFRRFILKKSLETSSETTPVLPNGTFYWRIRGMHAERKNSPWSPVLNFKVAEEILQPETPVITPSQLSYEVPLKVVERAPSNLTMDGPGLVPQELQSFAWKAVKNAESYEVEIASTEQFTNSLKHPLGPELRFAPKEVKPGPLFVRVRAKSQKGLVSPPSAIARLDVSLPAPKLQEIKAETQTFTNPKDLEQGKHNFQLNWSARPFASSYELNWGADPDFNKSKKFRLKGTSRLISVTSAGDYSARIRAIGANGEPLGPYSETQVASYRKNLVLPPPIAKPEPTPVPPPIPVVKAPKKPERTAASLAGFGTPEPLEPKRASSFVSLEDSTAFVSFRWKRVKDSKEYQIEIAEDADFENVIMRSSTKRLYFTVKKDLPEGRIFWRVRAIDKRKQPSDWSEVFDLNVLYQ